MKKHNIRTQTSSKTNVKNVYAKDALSKRMKVNRKTSTRLRKHDSRDGHKEEVKTTARNIHVQRGLTNNHNKFNRKTSVHSSSSDRRIRARFGNRVSRDGHKKEVKTTARNTHVQRRLTNDNKKFGRETSVHSSNSNGGMKARVRNPVSRERQKEKEKTIIRNTYIKRGVNKKVKLTRKPLVHPTSRNNGIRAMLREHIARQTKDKMKTNSKRVVRQIGRSVDPYEHEESHDIVKSLELPRDTIRKTRSAYKNVEKSVDLVKKSNYYLKNRRHRVPTISAHRKIKGNITTKLGSNNSFNKIKTLNSKFVPKGRYTSFGKSGMRKVATSAASYLKLAAQQVGKKLIAAVAANPKVWIVGVAAAAVIFFLMMLTNNLGGTSTSSAGSFFMTDEDNARKYKSVVERLDNEFQEEIRRMQSISGYDDIRTEYMNEDGFAHASWVEMFAILAVEFEQDLEFTGEQESFMETIYQKFNVVEKRTETYTESECYTDSKGNTKCRTVTKKRLIIEIYTYDMEDVFGKIRFNEEQQEWARRLVTSGAIQEQFPDLAQELPGGEINPGFPLPEFTGDVSEARQVLIETALTLEGRVKYFWGGKSSAGWNDNWGTMVKVTAPGSKTTGTYQPYGMDCSGFIDWAFKTAGLGNSFTAGGTSYQWSQTYQIKESDLIPGDLVFKNIPGQGGVNHIGIFIGRDTNGKAVYVHCEGGSGVVVNSYKGFKYPRRPLLFSGK